MLKSSGWYVKTILAVIFILITVCCVFNIADHVGDDTLRIDVYESETQYLVIEHLRDESILWSIKSSGGSESSAADFINENTAIFEGVWGQAEREFHYKFVFCDGYIELYNENGLQDIFYFMLNVYDAD